MSLSEFLAELNASGVRLWLDQGALRYSCPAPGLGDERLKKLVAAKSQICDLILMASAHAQTAEEGIARAHDETRLTFEQQRIWRSCLIDPATRAFNICGQAELLGALNVGALEQALSEIRRRHSVLRSRVVGPEDRCGLVADVDAVPELQLIDLTRFGDSDALVARLFGEEGRRAFDLRRGPLLRALLIARSRQRHLLVLTLHHLVCDHWSVQVLTRELHALYAAYAHGDTLPLPALHTLFSDYAAVESARAERGGFEDGLRFWEQHLRGLTATMFPSNPDVGDDTVASVQTALDGRALSALRAEVRTRHASLPVLLMTAFFALLREYVDEDDLCVGTTVVQRLRPDDEALIGLLINTLILRCDLSGASTLDVVLARMKTCWNASVAHSDVPFQMVLDRIRPGLAPQALPFNVGVEIRADVSLASEDVPGLRVAPVESRFVAPVRDLTLFLEEAADRLTVRFEYRNGAFAGNAIAGLHRRYVALLAALPALLPTPINALPLFEEPARASGGPAHDRFSTVVEALHRHALLRPDAIAMESISSDGPSTHLTYAALCHRVNRGAAALRLGVGSERVVAVRFEDPIECRVAMLAVMRAGAAPMPLAPHWSVARTQRLLAQTGAAAVLTDRAQADALQGSWPVWYWEDIAAGSGDDASIGPAMPSPGNLAWIHLQDGPESRAVAIEHSGLVRAVELLASALDEASGARLLATAAPRRKAFLVDLCVPLVCGGTVVMVDGSPPDAAMLLRAEPTVLHVLPGVLDMMLEARALPGSLRVVFTAGDVLYQHTLTCLSSHSSVERVIHGHACAESSLVSCTAVLRRRDRIDVAPAAPASDTARRQPPSDTANAMRLRHARTAVDAVTLLDARSRREVVETFNATERAYAGVELVHAGFEAQAARTPDAIAAMDEDGQVSYAELNRRANRLARYLRTCGVGPEGRVAVSVARGVPLVVCLLATLKAGGAYVPLDPGYPPARLAEMLADSRPAVVLQASGTEVPVTAAGSARCVWVDRDAQRWSGLSGADLEAEGLTPAHLAYVIYTSGSTGRPKGVMNAHRGVANRLRWMQEAYGLRAGEAVLQKTPCSFDVSVWEFYWPLLAGAKLVLARAEGHRDPGYLREVIEQEGIGTLHFVPSMLGAFLQEVSGGCGSLVRVFCSGEALPRAAVERFAAQWPQVGLHNLYGPTEAAVDVTAYACAGLPAQGEVPIGAPIANVRIYVLDGRGEPVPVGVSGEVHIGGVAVARGYWSRPALTAERFVADGCGVEAGARLYRTGDLGRWRKDGTIEYLGRNDDQVKLRGYRIELGEIEARLREHAQVREAAVVMRDDGAQARLVGYVTGFDAQAPEVDALRAHLQARLPGYMVPSVLVVLEAMPLAPNGKLDRRALPAPAFAAISRMDIDSVWEYEPADRTDACAAAGNPFIAAIGGSSSRNCVQLLRRGYRLAPLGVDGQIAISGERIARGYLGQPASTAARFQPDPTAHIAGSRRFLSDDMGRIGEDGALYFAGRRGDVRLHGRSIDLSSIEGALRADAKVRAVAVRVATDALGRSSLVAYVVLGGNESVDIEPDLREHLADRLSSHLVPESIIRVRALPLGPDGKVDRAQLPRLDRQGLLPSHTETERVLAGIWQEVLHTGSVNVERTFFELGGNSLSLLTVARLVSDRFERTVTAADMLRHVSIRSLARHLDAAHEGQGDSDAVQRRAAARLSALRDRPRRKSPRPS